MVTGADARVAGEAGAFAARAGESSRLRLVQAADHTEGMAASLRAGVRAFRDDTTGAFVFLGDMPRIPAALLPILAEALAHGALAAAPLFEGRRGHPVLSRLKRPIAGCCSMCMTGPTSPGHEHIIRRRIWDARRSRRFARAAALGLPAMETFSAFFALRDKRVLIAGDGEPAQAKARLFEGSPAEAVRLAGAAALSDLGVAVEMLSAASVS